MNITITFVILALIFQLAIAAALIYLFILLVRALKKYLSSKEVRAEKNMVCKSPGSGKALWSVR